MVAASLLPSGAVAYRLLAFSVATLTAREKVICGRNVTPTSLEPSVGDTPLTVKRCQRIDLTWRVRVA